MSGFDELFEKAKLFFDTDSILPLSGNWAKWFHSGIPDEPENVRIEKRKEAAMQGHCLECTSMSGCYFTNGERTFPKYPHHPKCHCKKLKENPVSVVSNCVIDKFTKFIFSDNVRAKEKRFLFENVFGYTIDDSGYLQSEYVRQAKEKYISGDYTLGLLNEYGQRINITIDLDSRTQGKVKIVSEWMVKPGGLITCNSPLGG